MKKADSGDSTDKLLSLYIIGRGNLNVKSYDLAFLEDYKNNKKLSGKASYVLANVDASNPKIYESGLDVFSYSHNAKSSTYVDWLFSKYIQENDLVRILKNVNKKTLEYTISKRISTKPDEIEKIAEVVGYTADEQLKNVVTENIVDSNFSEDKKIELMGKVGGSKACYLLKNYLIEAKGNLAQIGRDFTKNCTDNLENITLSNAKSSESYIVLAWIFLRLGKSEKISSFDYSKLKNISDEDIFNMGMEVIQNVFVSDSERILITLYESTNDWRTKRNIVNVIGNIGTAHSLVYLENLQKSGKPIPYGLATTISSAIDRLKTKLSK